MSQEASDLLRSAIRVSNIEFLQWVRKYEITHMHETLKNGKPLSPEELYDLWEEHKKKRT